MIKFLIPLAILVIICLFSGAAGLKLLAFIVICCGAGVGAFFGLRALMTLIKKLQLKKKQ